MNRPDPPKNPSEPHGKADDLHVPPPAAVYVVAPRTHSEPVTAPRNPRALARTPLAARLMDRSECLIQRIQAGLPKADALAAFLAACNQPDTMFITDRWIKPKLERLQPLLSDPISDSQAVALRELAAEKTRFDDVFDWLERCPAMSWPDYWLLREKEEVQRRQKMMEEGILPWTDVEASRTNEDLQRAARETNTMPAGRTCLRCHQPLTWLYFQSPAWTWAKLCGRAGWLGVCDPCHLQIDFVLCVMN